MTRFDTLKQLIDYCLLCPICNSKRDLEFSVGPDTPTPNAPNLGEENDTDLIRLINYELTEDRLLFVVKIHVLKSRYQITFNIDTNTNRLTSFYTTLYEEDSSAITKATAPQFYFNIWAQCGQCRNSQLNTHEINLDILSKVIYPLEVECETRSLTVGSSGFQLEYDYLNTIDPQAPKIITVFRLKERSHSEFYDGPHPDFELYGQPVYFPMTEFDFSDIPALYKRLSTLIFFS